MFHANTQQMIDYWTARAPAGRAPRRSSIDPGDFRQLMTQAFIVGRDGRGAYPFRLAGGFVAELHGRDLRALNVMALWSERDRLRLDAALEEVRGRPQPLVVMAEALSAHASLSLEVLFAPIAAENGRERFLGLYQPLGMVSRLKGAPVLELSVRALKRTGAANEEGPLRVAAFNGRRIA